MRALLVARSDVDHMRVSKTLPLILLPVFFVFFLWHRFSKMPIRYAPEHGLRPKRFLLLDPLACGRSARAAGRSFYANSDVIWCSGHRNTDVRVTVPES